MWFGCCQGALSGLILLGIFTGKSFVRGSSVILIPGPAPQSAMTGNPKPYHHLKAQELSEPSLLEGCRCASGRKPTLPMRLTKCMPLGVSHLEVKAIGLGSAGLLGAENLLSFFQEQGLRSAQNKALEVLSEVQETQKGFWGFQLVALAAWGQYQVGEGVPGVFKDKRLANPYEAFPSPLFHYCVSHVGF